MPWIQIKPENLGGGRKQNKPAAAAKPQPCPTCSGVGLCPACGGEGEPYRPPPKPWEHDPLPVGPCSTCNGTGMCQACGGSGIARG